MKELDKSVAVRGNLVRVVGAAVFVTELHGRRLHDGPKERVDLPPLGVGHHLRSPYLCFVVVQEGDERLVRRTAERGAVDGGEERIGGAVVPLVRLFAALHIDFVVAVGVEAVHVQVPKVLGGLGDGGANAHGRRHQNLLRRFFFQHVRFRLQTDALEVVHHDIDASEQRHVRVPIVSQEFAPDAKSGGARPREFALRRRIFALEECEQLRVLLPVYAPIFEDLSEQSLRLGLFERIVARASPRARLLRHHAGRLQDVDDGVDRSEERHIVVVIVGEELASYTECASSQWDQFVRRRVGLLKLLLDEGRFLPVDGEVGENVPVELVEHGVGHRCSSLCLLSRCGLWQ
mmetsp:Transcript_17686/g.32847  ORF Transcript_17686/g.32847 Transcript_17686/m.32847 type:complete len:347 (-) Transcript_17686:11-1051(-)